MFDFKFVMYPVLKQHLYLNSKPMPPILRRLSLFSTWRWVETTRSIIDVDMLLFFPFQEDYSDSINLLVRSVQWMYSNGHRVRFEVLIHKVRSRVRRTDDCDECLCLDWWDARARSVRTLFKYSTTSNCHVTWMFDWRSINQVRLKSSEDYCYFLS